MDLAKLRDSLGAGRGAFDVKLFEIGGTSITIATLVTFVVIVILTLLVSWLIQRALERVFRARDIRHPGAVGLIGSLVHYAVIVLGLAIGLETVGINLSALFAAGAVFAIGLGFAMQNLVQNFVSGVILILERVIKPGDVLSVEGKFVKVTKIGVRTTQARTLDDEEIIVPNGLIVQSTVTNYTLRDSYYRIRCTVGVSYGSDMALVRRTLEATAESLTWRSPDKSPVVLLTEFGSSSVDFEVSVWIDDPWNVRRRKSEALEAIWWALKEAEITIAFPQVDVHFDPPVVQSMQALRPTG